MYGWIHTCLEKMVLTKHGEATWKEIKDIAKCTVKNGDWIRYENYSDEETFALIHACAKVLKIQTDLVLEIFGTYFILISPGMARNQLLGLCWFLVSVSLVSAGFRP